ncbi:protein NIM1-INTERACTING 2-like [Quercus lobata]|nr:protein NIM1-INTERACTING 2-like [Quercus lobata]
MAAEESKEKRTLAVAAEDDAVSGKQQKKARGGDVESVTEAEVEEFFAILRRIHVAVSYFKKNNDRWIKEEEGSRLRAILEGESKEEENENVEENLGLDLNAVPAPE